MPLEIFQQDEGSPVGDSEDFDDGASLDVPEEAGAPEGTGEESAEATPQEPEQPEQPEAPVEDPSAYLRNENASLRSTLRQQQRELAKMQAQFARINKQLEESAKVPKADENDFFSGGMEEAPKQAEVKEPEYSLTEQYDAALRQLATERAPLFEIMLDTMEMNPKFQDVRTVCTQARVDDLTEAMAQHIASRDNRDPVEVQLQIEYDIWSKPQPFKYLYDTIKQYHPDFAKPEQKPATTETPVPGGGRVPKPAKAPTSVMDVGGGSKEGSTGWTSKRIDEIPEDDLHKVPADVYQKYLAGQLD